jgi:hypothetical protein
MFVQLGRGPRPGHRAKGGGFGGSGLVLWPAPRNPPAHSSTPYPPAAMGVPCALPWKLDATRAVSALQKVANFIGSPSTPTLARTPLCAVLSHYCDRLSRCDMIRIALSHRTIIDQSQHAPGSVSFTFMAFDQISLDCALLRHASNRKCPL